MPRLRKYWGRFFMSTGERGQVCGIVPAGVHPWGDSCLDEVMPRVLLPVIGTPLIVHVIEALREIGVRDHVVCANSASPIVRKALGDGSRLSVELSYYEDITPRGPAGCIRDAAALTDGKRFVVIDGSVLPLFDLGAMISAHITSGAAATVAVCHDVSAHDGMREQLVPAGVYVFERRAVEAVPATGYQDAKEVLLPRLSKEGAKVLPFDVGRMIPRVGDASSYLAANERLLRHYLIAATPPRGYRRRGDALVHISATVSERAKLIGPMLIGPRSEVDDAAILVGPLVLGNDCRVMGRTTLCRTVVWNECQLGNDLLLDNCIVTSNVALNDTGRYYGSLLTQSGAVQDLTIRGINQSPAAGGSSRIWDIRAHDSENDRPGGQRAARTAVNKKKPAFG